MSTTKTTVKVQHLPASNQAALYRRNPGAPRPQACNIHLDCRTGVLWAWACPYEPDTVNPALLWRREISWSIPLLKSAAANHLLDEIAPLAERVLDGYSERWNGSNYLGRYTASAEIAIADIETMCGDVDVTRCGVRWVDACDWYVSGEIEAVARPGMSQTEIEAAASELDRDSINNGEIDIIEGTAKMIRDAVDALAA